MSLQVQVIPIHDLNEDLRADLGDGWKNALIITHNDEYVGIYTDNIEPEDISFWRDLRWVASAIEDAYHRGVRDGNCQCS